MSVDAEIRPMLPSEAEAVSELIVTAVRKDLPGWYDPEVVEGLAAGNSPDAVRSHGPKQTDYVYLVDGRIVGMVGVKRNEIGHLYVAVECARRGIGRKLVAFAADLFGQAGWEDMFVYASLYAVGFYERCGFAAEGRGSFPVGGGAELEYVQLRRSLQAARTLPPPSP